MKLSIALVIVLLIQNASFRGYSQNAVKGPVGLYGVSYNASTTLLSGGSIYVGSGGNWYLGGSIIGEDKGTPKSVSSTGQSEVITFDGTGKISNAVATPGQAGNYINGYAVTTGTSASSLVLPVGGTSAVYPFTVPAGTAVKVAYFDGSGSSTSVPVNGTSTIEFSQYYDLPAGWPAGTYSLAYPSGMIPNNNAILKSTAGSSFSLVVDIPNLSTTAGTVVSASLPASTASRLYLSTSAALLPVQLNYFHGSRRPGYNLLQWAVGEPRRIDHFQLYKQEGQASQFLSVFSVRASDTVSAYSWQDPADTASAYYRLAVVSKSGVVFMSQVVFLPGEDNIEAAVAVHPNPASSVLTISLYSRTTEDLYCSIFDMAGQKIAAKVVRVEGPSNVQWDISAFPKGNYMLNVRNGQTGKSQHVQFVKL